MIAMKKFLNFCLLVSLLVLVVMGCKKNLVDELSEGMTFTFSTEQFLAHKVNVNLINANLASSVKPSPLLAVYGIDADKVFELNGGRELKIVDNLARLVVGPGQTISSSRPLTFTLRAEAPGFLPVEKSISVSSLDSFSTYTLEMIEMAQPPRGVSLEITEIRLNGNGLTSDASTLEMPSKAGSTHPQQVRISIPAGTMFNDASGRPVSGNVKAIITHFNETDASVKAQMFYNVISRPVLVRRDNSTAEEGLFALATLNIEMTARGKNVEQFSKPLEAMINIDPGTINPMTSKPYQAGDEMNVYSLSAGTDVWHFEGRAKVVNSASGNLAVSFAIPHLSTWAIGPAPLSEGICRTRMTLNFRREVAYKGNMLHYIEVRDQANDDLLQSYNEVPLIDRGRFRLTSSLPANRTVNIIVYEYDTKALNDALSGRIVGHAITSSCAASAMVTLDVPSVTARPVMSFNITAICYVDGKAISYKHDGRVQYRVRGSGEPWRDLGISANSHLVTDRLDWDRIYDFKTIISGKVNGLNGSIEAVEKTRKRNTKQTEFTNSPAGSIFWQFNRKDWVVAPEDCEDMAQYFKYK